VPRLAATRANGQRAFANCFWDAERKAFVANDIVVLTMDGASIAELTAWLRREIVERFGLPREPAS
jgi:hypothetical protein